MGIYGEATMDQILAQKAANKARKAGYRAAAEAAEAAKKARRSSYANSWEVGSGRSVDFGNEDSCY